MSAPIGVIAGGGLLASLLCQELTRQKKAFFVLLLDGFADFTLFQNYPHTRVRLGGIGQILKILSEHNIKDLVFAGSVSRPSLSALRPDRVALKWIAQIGAKAMGDDGLFRGIIQHLEKEGFTIHSVTSYLPTLLTPPGLLTKLGPTSSEEADIQKAFQVAKDLGRWDIGQGVIIEEGVILALEGIEGTQAMLERTKPLKRLSKGGILVKVSKPSQEERIDLPTIGRDTIQQAALLGLRGIALEAGHSLILSLPETLTLANKHQLFLIGVSG